jgi:hypothetical protein
MRRRFAYLAFHDLYKKEHFHDKCTNLETRRLRRGSNTDTCPQRNASRSWTNSGKTVEELRFGVTHDNAANDIPFA